MHILKSQDFTKLFMDDVFRLTSVFKKHGYFTGSSMAGKTMATLFYEPSTRTRFSFERAMQQMGGNVISTENAAVFSSASKGETLEDSIRVVSSYADIIVLRHPEEGAAERAAKVSGGVPIINAGDGAGQHPTQALIDMYTIWNEFEHSFSDLQVALVGDLEHSRTIHSLVYLLAKYDIENMFLVGKKLPDSFSGLPAGLQEHLFEVTCKFTRHESLSEIAALTDVFYMTRPQTERWVSNGMSMNSNNWCEYHITKEIVDVMADDAIVMHPLPRYEEIPTWFDDDPRARYFEQAANGVPVRAALIKMAIELP